MPQLVKGGKWVYGWAIVGPGNELPIPLQAWQEYGFQAGTEAVLVRGSRHSGGFGVGTAALLERFGGARERLGGRIFGRGRFVRARFVREGFASLPPEVDVSSGQRLLVVRGSGRALGFVACGPIYEEALRHPELRVVSRG
jgi:hypothetical protein